jgi:AraC family transcriptional regulator
MLALAIEPDFASALTEQEKIDFNRPSKRNDPVITRLAEMLLEEMKQASLAGRVFGESLINALVFHLVSHHQDKKGAFRMMKGKLASVELKRVLEYLHNNLGEDLSLHQLAGLVNLSAFHFSRLFQNTLGLAPHQFVLQLRLERAQRLLRQQHVSLTRIAAELGFSDQAHFSKAFRKATGVSPREYRRE